jgi:hypothetical protein
MKNINHNEEDSIIDYNIIFNDFCFRVSKHLRHLRWHRHQLTVMAMVPKHAVKHSTHWGCNNCGTNHWASRVCHAAVHSHHVCKGEWIIEASIVMLFRIIVVDVISPLLLPLALAWSQLSNTEPPQPARRNNSHPPTYSSAHRILRLCRKIVVVSATTKVHWHQSTMVRWYGIQHSKGRQRTESLSTIIVGDCYHWLRLRSHQFLHPYLCMSCCSES